MNQDINKSITEKKIQVETQLNEQLTEFGTMQQKEVDRIIVHDIYGQPVKRKDGTVFKDPRDDPALGQIGRDVLNPSSNIIKTAGNIPQEEIVTGKSVKKKGFIGKMKDKYHDWKERRRQKKLAQERGEPTSPLSPSPAKGHIVTMIPTTAIESEQSKFSRAAFPEPTAKDISKTGTWDYPDQRIQQTELTLIDPITKKERLARVEPANVTPSTILGMPQLELKSGIIHPGLSSDFATKPQAEFLVDQNENIVQNTDMVIEDMTRPAKNLLEGVSGAYGVASNPFQPINDKADLRNIHSQSRSSNLISGPAPIRKENLMQGTTGFESSTKTISLTEKLPSQTIQTSIETPLISTTGLGNKLGTGVSGGSSLGISQSFEPVQGKLPLNMSQSGFNTELHRQGIISPTERVISIEPITNVKFDPSSLNIPGLSIGQTTKNLPVQEFRTDLTEIPSERMSIQPGMVGDLTTGLIGDRSIKSSERLKKPFE